MFFKYKKVNKVLSNTNQFGQNFNIIICHSDPYKNIGGVEKYVTEKANLFIKKSIKSIIIFPKLSKTNFFKNRLRYCININDNEIDQGLNFHEIKRFLKGFNKTHSIHNIFIEHLAGWTKHRSSLCKLISSLNGIKHISIHDNSYRCPSKFLFVEGHYCGALEDYFNEKKCYSCKYGKYRKIKLIINKKIFSRFFKVCDFIIVPSEYLKNKIISYYDECSFNNKIKVVDLFPKKKLFIPSNSRILDDKQKIKIAFLGNLGTLKGFEEFVNISKNNELKKNYSFYVIGRKYKDSNIINIEASYLQKKENSLNGSVVSYMLYKHGINIAFLFSKAPESYSFTAHEAHQSGVPIFTNHNSGNIAYNINCNNIYGKSFKNINEVINFMLNKHKVIDFVNNNKKDI